jgi:endonuclease-3
MAGSRSSTTRQGQRAARTQPAESQGGRQTEARPTLPAVSESEKRRAQRLYKKLEQTYPDATCALRHEDAYQLLVATILSAQCTDERVNKVTPALFAAYPTAADLAKAPQEEIEHYIQSTGFYRNKAKSLRGAAQAIVEEHDGDVPDTIEALTKLPGVARKTANVILGNIFDKNMGVVVDTHVHRLAQRLGLSEQKDPKKVELELMALFPRKKWTMLAHLLIFHGRQICKARSPLCSQCPVRRMCPQVGVVNPQ